MGTTYTPAFEKSFLHIIGVEGKFSAHPKDLGGSTKYGITEVTARSYGYKGNMQTMPIEVAKEIYYLRFWKPNGLETIAYFAPHLAERMFDIGVNVGMSRAITWLQMALNAFNVQESRYADIKEDGIWGQQTRNAMESFLTWRGRGGDSALEKAITCLQGHHYIHISRVRPDNEEFVYGWITNRVVFRGSK